MKKRLTPGTRVVTSAGPCGEVGQCIGTIDRIAKPDEWEGNYWVELDEDGRDYLFHHSDLRVLPDCECLSQAAEAHDVMTHRCGR